MDYYYYSFGFWPTILLAVLLSLLLLLLLLSRWPQLIIGCDDDGVGVALPMPGFIEMCLIARNELHVCPHETLAKIGKRLGGVYQLKLPCFRGMVLITDFKIMKDALVGQSEVFAGRPKMLVSEMLFQDTTILFTDGPELKEKRRFVLHNLRNLGFGKTNVMESVITTEILKLADILDRNSGKKIVVNHLFFMPVLNILIGLIAGKQYDYGDAKIRHFEKMMRGMMVEIQNNMAINFMAWIRFLPHKARILRSIRAKYDEVKRFLDEEIDAHLTAFEPNAAPTNLIDAYLGEMHARRTKKTSSSSSSSIDDNSYTRRNLVGILSDLLQAATDTTVTTMEWTLLYMAMWPEIQQKNQDEVDRVIGSDRAPTYGDLCLMPYVEATMMEIHRYTTVLPLSGPHSSMSATKLNGFTIPKRAVVLQNTWAVHHDPDLWGDPEVFRPERFINDAGKVEKPEYLIPFSLGGRKCIGESLARIELFLLTVSLLQRYTFRYATGEPPPDTKLKMTQIKQLQDFSLIATKRSGI